MTIVNSHRCGRAMVGASPLGYRNPRGPVEVRSVFGPAANCPGACRSFLLKVSKYVLVVFCSNNQQLKIAYK